MNPKPLNDDEILWQMLSKDAAPLIMQKFNLSEVEAFKMWLSHQHDETFDDDVVFLEFNQESKDFEELVRNNSVGTYLFNPGRKMKHSDETIEEDE